MKNIKSKKPNEKEIELVLKMITKLEPVEFIGIMKICGINLYKQVEVKEEETDNTDSDNTNSDNTDDVAATSIEQPKTKTVIKDFYEILDSFMITYKASKKSQRQYVLNLIDSCINSPKKKVKKGSDNNGIESEDTKTESTISSETM